VGKGGPKATFDAGGVKRVLDSFVVRSDDRRPPE
jgi:hypothetical protein